ncbi:hypothetical protein Tco_0986592, partial [Tanacetum coccineum]
LIRFGRVPVSAAKQSSFRAVASTSAVKQVNTTTHTNRVNVSKTRKNTFHKSHSHIRRPFHKSTAPNTSISNEKVNTVRVKGVKTAGQTAVSAGNPQQALKNKGIFDSGCSRHMTGNKDFLTDYQDIDGGFVAFGGTKGQKFNFSKLIFDGMLRNLDPKKFLMYPRFLQLFLNIQLPNLVIPFNDIYETPKLTKKVGDEAINEAMFDSVERAITTDASLDAAQDSDNITKTQSTETFMSLILREKVQQFTIEERAQFLVETIAAQRKFRAAQRAVEIRSGYKHSQLKGKTYEEIQGLYEREQKFIHDFVPMDSEKEEKKSMEPESKGKKSKRLKRTAGSYATHKSPKTPKVMKYVKNVTEEEATEYEKEKEELRLSLKIISGDDSEVNYEPLSRIFPIMNWEYKLLGNMDAKDMYVYKLTRADGSSSYHGDMQAFLRRLDRQDSNDLYRLVQERFQDHPLEGHDLLLWGDIRMLL